MELGNRSILVAVLCVKNEMGIVHNFHTTLPMQSKQGLIIGKFPYGNVTLRNYVWPVIICSILESITKMLIISEVVFGFVQQYSIHIVQKSILLILTALGQW